MFLRLCQLGSETAIWLLSSCHQIWLKANRRWLQGKSATIGRGRIRRCFSVGEASTVRYFGVILEVFVDNQVKQSSLRQGYLRLLPVGCPFQGSLTGSGAERLTHTSVQSRHLGLTVAVVQHWWCQVHPPATTSPMDYGINCPVLVLAPMMWESLFRKPVFYMESFRWKTKPNLAPHLAVQRDCMESKFAC